MKKVFLASAILFAGIISVNAQSEGFKFGAGLKAVAPIGDFGKVSSFGIGVEGQGEYMFSSAVSGVGSIGYTHYFEKDDSGADGGIVPILAGIRFYPATEFFVGAKAGVAISTSKGGGSAFNYLPHIGYNSETFQISLGYDAWTKNSFTSGAIAATGIIKF